MFLQIKTPTGYKDLSTIQVGDKVCAFDTEVNIVEGIDLWTAETNDYENQGDFIYYLINGVYKFYKNQSIYVNDVINHVFMLQVGDIIYDENDKDVVVTSIEELTDETQFYRLTISGDHTYILDGIIVHNASRYWVGGGSSVNWNATGNTNWAGSSGGAGNQSVPTSIDAVFFDTTASPATISATITILSFEKTSGYTGTITRSATLTVAGNFKDNTAGFWAGSSGLTISAASNMTSGGQTWGAPLTFNSTTATIRTLFGNWSVTLVSILGSAVTLNKDTTETLTATGGLTMSSNTLQTLGGTADVILTGGTWSGVSGFACNSLTIAGNVAISNGVTITTTTLTYSSGTVTHSGTFNLSGNCTLNTAGITWSNITMSGAPTATITSLLTITGTLTLSSGSTCAFAGTAGFTCSNLIGGASGLAQILTLQAGITYTATSALTVNGTRIGLMQTITSSSGVGGTKAILTLNSGATCNVLSNFTRIDASAGKTISTFNGTVTDCSNVIRFNDMPVSGF